jgi:hypothetical protein
MHDSFFNLPSSYLIHKPVPVAAQSKVQVLAVLLLGSWVQILLRAWMFCLCVYKLCFPVSVEAFVTS